MQSHRPRETNCFIYSPMSRDAADAILLEKIAQLPPDQVALLKAGQGTKVWLLRESTKDGLLTFQSAQWDADSNQWQAGDPQRIALVASGWTNANLLPLELTALLQNSQKVKKEDFPNHADQLLEFLQRSFDLHIENRINPEAKQRTKNNIYSNYITPLEEEIGRTRKKVKTEIELPEDILTAITCPITRKTFKDSVVNIYTRPLQNLRRGLSYERAALEEMKLEEGTDFIPNHKLNLIVNYLGAQEHKLVKLKKIDEHEINDAVDFEKIKQAHITPAGQTYSYTTIVETVRHAGVNAKDPINPNIGISIASSVQNFNIDIFISGWSGYYEQRKKELTEAESLEEISAGQANTFLR